MAITNEQINYLRKQLEKVNAERATAVKALQEIENYLRGLPEDYEGYTLAYMTAFGVLNELGEDK